MSQRVLDNRVLRLVLARGYASLQDFCRATGVHPSVRRYGAPSGRPPTVDKVRELAAALNLKPSTVAACLDFWGDEETADADGEADVIEQVRNMRQILRGEILSKGDPRVDASPPATSWREAKASARVSR